MSKPSLETLDSDSMTITCRDCSRIREIPDSIRFLEIITTKKCYISGELLCKSNLEELVVTAKSIEFGEIKGLSDLKRISILEPMQKDVPEFLNNLPNLNRLLIHFRDDQNYENLKKIESLEQLSVRIEKIIDGNLPPIVLSPNLKLLRVFSSTSNFSFSNAKLALSNKIEILELTGDLSFFIESIKALPRIRVLKVNTFSKFSEQIDILLSLPGLEQLCINDMSDEDRNQIYRMLPARIELKCFDNHIFSDI